MPDRLVYSTEGGRISTCPTCGQPYSQCRCDQPPAPSKRKDDIVRVMRDRKQRGGKTVTVIDGWPGAEADLTTLAQQLKKRCGSGGTVKDGMIWFNVSRSVKVM